MTVNSLPIAGNAIHDGVLWGRPLHELAAIELRRQLRSILLWVAAVLTVVAVSWTTTDFSGGSYGEKILGFMPLFVAALIGGYRSGRRDHPETLAESAPLGAATRPVAHLAGVAVPVAMTAVIVVGLAIISRIEGGYWLGDTPRRTDAAQHSVLELVQPVLFIALAGAFGVAIARAARGRSVALLIVALLVWFLSFPGWWVPNIAPFHTVAIVQVQPFSIDVGTDIDVESLPSSWFVDAPTEHTESWQRQLVHQPTVAGHDLYLGGLVVLAAGAAIRSRTGRRLALAGSVAAVGGVIVQLLAMPSGLV